MDLFDQISLDFPCVCHFQRSREHSEGSTKRTKQCISDDEVLGELDCEGPGSDAEKQTQEQGSVDDGQDVQEDEANYSASTNASVQHLREQIDRFTTQVREITPHVQMPSCQRPAVM